MLPSGRQACNFIEERPPHWCFRTSRLQNKCSRIIPKIHVCWSLFLKRNLEVDIHRCSSKKLQISQESICVGLFFNKVASPQNCNFIKKRFQHRSICEIFRSTLFYRTSPVATSESFRFHACNFIKKETPAKCFSVNFATSFLLTEHLRMTASVKFKKFFRVLLL